MTKTKINDFLNEEPSAELGNKIYCYNEYRLMDAEDYATDDNSMII